MPIAHRSVFENMLHVQQFTARFSSHSSSWENQGAQSDRRLDNREKLTNFDLSSGLNYIGFSIGKIRGNSSKL